MAEKNQALLIAHQGIAQLASENERLRQVLAKRPYQQVDQAIGADEEQEENPSKRLKFSQ